MPKKLYQINTEEEVNLDELLSAEDRAPQRFAKGVGSRHRRHLLWPLIILSAFLLIFIGNYWYGSVKKSVGFTLPDFLRKQLADTAQSPEQTIADLKSKDTDRDGLSDYDELYQFHSSIFLPDTDSDGISDADEVAKGTDPTCPTGQQCNLLKLITPETKLANILKDLSVDKDLTLQQATANEFRKFLLDNGMPQADLDKLTDDDLLNILAIVDESNIFPESAWSATTTPDQVRSFLASQPDADVEKIKNMSDAELLKIRDQLIGSK